MVDVLFFIAEVIFLISYLCKDMLYLRTVTLIALVGYLAGALMAGFNQPGMKVFIVFTVLTFIVNIYEVALIIISRMPILLPEELKKVYNHSFKMMTPKEFFKMYQIGHVKKCKKGEILAVQNQMIPELILLKSGEVNIIKNDEIITQLGAGYFIGEMSFLTGEMASATVKVNSDELECIVWEKTKLESLEKSNEDLHEKIRRAIAINVVKKLERHA